MANMPTLALEVIRRWGLVKGEDGETKKDRLHILFGRYFPLGLTRMEEVVLRRIRLGVALTPARTHGWKRDYRGPMNCPTCSDATTPADLHHLLWTCPGTQDLRRKYVMVTGLDLRRDSHYHRWLHGPAHRALLDYIRDAKLASWI